MGTWAGNVLLFALSLFGLVISRITPSCHFFLLLYALFVCQFHGNFYAENDAFMIRKNHRFVLNAI